MTGMQRRNTDPGFILLILLFIVTHSGTKAEDHTTTTGVTLPDWPVYTGMLNPSYEWVDALEDNGTEAFENMTNAILKHHPEAPKNMLIISFNQGMRVFFRAKQTTVNTSCELTTVYNNKSRLFTTILAGPPIEVNETYSHYLRLVFNESVVNSDNDNVTIWYVEDFLDCFYAEVPAGIEIINITEGLVLMNFAMPEAVNVSQIDIQDVFATATWNRVRFIISEDSSSAVSTTDATPAFDLTTCYPEVGSTTSQVFTDDYDPTTPTLTSTFESSAKEITTSTERTTTATTDTPLTQQHETTSASSTLTLTSAHRDNATTNTSAAGINGKVSSGPSSTDLPTTTELPNSGTTPLRANPTTENIPTTSIATDSSASDPTTTAVEMSGNTTEFPKTQELTTTTRPTTGQTAQSESSAKAAATTHIQHESKVLCHGFTTENGITFPTEEVQNVNNGSLKSVSSTDKCENGRAMATIYCRVIDYQVAKYDIDSFVSFDCNITAKDITGQRKFATDRELQYALRILQIFQDSGIGGDLAASAEFFRQSILATSQSGVKISYNTFETAMIFVDTVTDRLSSGSITISDPSILTSITSAVDQYCIHTVIQGNVAEIQAVKLVIKLTDAYRTKPLAVALTFNNSTQLDVHFPTTALAANSTSPLNRVSVVFYTDDTLFPSSSSENPQSVVSINVGEKKLSDLKDPINITFSAVQEQEGRKNIPGTLTTNETTIKCVFYDENYEWSQEGVRYDGGSAGSPSPVTCVTSHLTNFAVLVSRVTVPQDVALNIISKIGCALSVLGFFLTIILYLISKKWKKNRPALEMLHVCLNLLIAYTIFLVGLTPGGNRAACVTITALMQYFFLAAWLWLGIYTRDMYTSLVQVYGEQQRHYVAIITSICYGVPLLIVVLHVGIAVGHFDKANEDARKSTYYGENFCWLHDSSLYFGFLLPIALILFHNLASCALVIYEIAWKSESIDSSAKKQSAKTKLMLAIVIGTLVGLTWIFAFLLILSTDVTYMAIMQWLFAISNATQGISMFLILCVRSKDIRAMWWPPLRRKICLPVLRVCFKQKCVEEDTGIRRFSSTTTTTRRTYVNDKSSYSAVQQSKFELTSSEGSEKSRRKNTGARLSISNSSSSSEQSYQRGKTANGRSDCKPLKNSPPKRRNKCRDKCVIVITSPAGDKVSEETIKI